MEIDCPFDKLLPITEAVVWSWFGAMHAQGDAVAVIRMPKWAFPKVMKIFTRHDQTVSVMEDGFDRWLAGAMIVPDKRLKDSVALIAW